MVGNGVPTVVEPESSGPTVTDPVDAEALRMALETSVLDGIRPHLVIAFLVMVVFVAIDREQRPLDPLVVGMLFSFGMVAVAVLGKSFNARRRKLAFVVGAGLASCAGLFHFGPLIGTGVFFALTILVATFFFDGLGSIVATTATVVSVSAYAFLSSTGWLHIAPTPPSSSDWLRIVLATITGALGCSYLAQRTVGSMRRSLAIETSARRAETKARRIRDQAQRDRESLLQKSMASQKLESVGRLAGGVAHDFNNSLMVIRAGVEIMRDAPTLSADDRQVLTEVLSAVDSAAATSKQLLAFGTTRPEDVGSCSPNNVLPKFVASIRRMLPESVTVQVNVSPAPLPDIPLSRPALEQVLLNLILNARDAMSSGGTITLGAAIDPVTFQVLVTVADTGAGMSEAVRARIFEPFYTTKKDRGTGLGLAMVWGVVTHAGGAIDVKSVEAPAAGSGSTFALRFFPVEKRESSGRNAIVARPARTLRVLLLEDQAEVLRAITRMLVAGGYEACAFERAQPAAASLGESSYDVLVTDVVVPDGGVAELIASFRALYPQAPVIVCSGHVDEELVAVGIQQGDYEFLRKPFTSAQLLAKLAELTSAAPPVTSTSG